MSDQQSEEIRKQQDKKDSQKIWLLLIGPLLLTIIFTPAFIKANYGPYLQAFRSQYYRTDTLSIIALQPMPYDCCICSCSTDTCVEASDSAPTCDALIALTSSGLCGNGAGCCSMSEATCSLASASPQQFGNSSYSCSECTAEAVNQQCESYCSSCYRPTIIMSYTPESNSSVSALVTHSTHCAMDDNECVKLFFGNFAIAAAAVAIALCAG